MPHNPEAPVVIVAGRADAIAPIQRLPRRIIGLGINRPHIESPDAFA